MKTDNAYQVQLRAATELRIYNAIKELIEVSRICDDSYFCYAHAIALILPARLIEQLRQLVNGPVWDGDVISKSDRNELINLGIAIKVCCKGEQGYTAAKFIGYTIMKHIEKGG